MLLFASAAENRQMLLSALNARIMAMIRRLVFLLTATCLLIMTVRAQGVQTDLLARVNGLRQSLGLQAYTPHSALNAAALNHATWLARTGISSHYQEDGSGPRARAPAAGYSSTWVSENFFFGLNASIERAWNFWLNSPAHYAGLVSPYYNNIGIGSAASGGRKAFVLVFGNSSGRLLDSGAASTAAGNAADRAAPSFVVGLDDAGNIMHEVQGGDTIGDIALIYGYTWQDIPYMLEINGMSAEDIRLLKPGSIFLVPPKDGTFTPIPATPAATPSKAPASATATVTATAEPTVAATAPAPTANLQIGGLPTSTPVALAGADETLAELTLPGLLVAAAVAQAGIIVGASILLIRGWR